MYALIAHIGFTAGRKELSVDGSRNKHSVR